jgi:hypothetical protein
MSEKGKIVYAIEELEAGKRYLRVRRWFPNGGYRDEYQEVPYSDRPLLFVPNFGGDIDDIALRDITQEVQGTPVPEREDKPDVPKLYDELRENRAIELSGRRHYGMWPRKKGKR